MSPKAALNLCRIKKRRKENWIKSQYLNSNNHHRLASQSPRYPNRPRNHAPTLPFRTLFQDLFNPLSQNLKKSKGPQINRRRAGPHAGRSQNPVEIRRAIIERFFSRWRHQVGDDIYPAFRLIIPDKDRERAMYGLKEKVLGKLLIKIMQIDRNSEDGYALLNWKLPGQSAASRMAGDFAGRCYEVISKRPLLVEPGDMTIAEVNEQLDRLAAAQKEENQLPVLQGFYQRMNAEELMWLVRIILRQMKVGATEKTFLEIWHPDAEALFNVSSSLRRVCWQLYSHSIRLESEDRGVVHLMECFQPQLAQFQEHGIAKIIQKLRPEEDDPEFWIEEKLDGERMQLHMASDPETPGGKKFAFFSRKAKDYTYLYGSGFEDENAALTRHLRPAFADDVENIVLDGEMITWDAETDMVLPFGTLKTAAISEQRNPFAGKSRPLYRVFDILYLNDVPLTRYTLRDRRRALERSVKSVHRRLEIHEHTVATKEKDVEDALRQIVASASEGLVLKNPRSMYRLNDRNDDWMKVKPEYMTEFGESLDCLIIGGYYGSGRRGGALSSFLCGLRVEESWAKRGDWHPELCWSFFKVGGGLNANDYATIRHHTEGKWKEWDPKNPPTHYIELAGGDLQYERPDLWIKPEDSVVVEVKAAQVSPSDSFRLGKTLRFPRFTRLRMDKGWKNALSVQEFLDLQSRVEKERKDKEFKMDERRKRRKLEPRKKTVQVAGYGVKAVNSVEKIDGTRSQVFNGLTFYIMTESTKPERKSKLQLEEMVKANGGAIVQTHNVVKNTVCVAERRTVKVASLEKKGGINILRPAWLFDCIAQAQKDFPKGLDEMVVPLEMDRHLYSLGVEDEKDWIEDNVDEWGDSYARDTSVEELKETMEKMAKMDTAATINTPMEVDRLLDRLGHEQSDPTWMFRGLTLFFDQGTPIPGNSQTTAAERRRREAETATATATAHFAGATFSTDFTDGTTTHVVVPLHPDRGRVQNIRNEVAGRSGHKLSRIVTQSWIEESWRARTRLDEERFVPSPIFSRK